MRAAVVLATLALLASSSLAVVDDAAAPSPARAPNPGEDPASTSGPGGFPTKTDVSLMRWISAKGGAFVGVGVYSFVAPGDADDSELTDARYGSRAMYAKDADVTNGAEVFRIPTDAVMTAPSEAAGPVLNRLASLDPEWALATMLLRERSMGDASPHAAFVDAMYAHPPWGARVGKMPRGSDADAALRETRAGDSLARWRDDHTRAWLAVESLCVRRHPKEFPPGPYFNPRVFEEALAMVHASSVRFPAASIGVDGLFTSNEYASDGKSGKASSLAAALVPIAHLMPHDPRGTVPCVTVHGDGGTPTFVVKAAGGAPGTELTCNRAPAKYLDFGDDERKSMTRGRMTDAEALARFGTVGPGRNVHDRLPLSLPIESLLEHDGDARVNAHRKEMIHGCGDSAEYAFDANGPTRELICALRVATATDAEISELAARHTGKKKKKKKKKDTPEAVFAKMVSEDSEAAALASLYETAAAILDSYPTSDAEDEAILRRGLREETEEPEGAEGADTAVRAELAVVGETREAVRCRLREKLLVIEALNALRVAAERRLKGNVPFELRTDFGDGAAGGTKRREGVEMSPPDGFEARKAHYKSDEL